MQVKLKDGPLVEFSGQVVSSFQRSVLDGKTVYERQKQKSFRKALVFDELLKKPRTRVRSGTVLASCWVRASDQSSHCSLLACRAARRCRVREEYQRRALATESS